MDLFHVTRSGDLPVIMRDGLLPERSGKGAVFLWDSLEVAMDNLPWSEGEFVVLRARIPSSWVALDDGYLSFEPQAGHAFRVERRIPPHTIQKVREVRVA